MKKIYIIIMLSLVFLACEERKEKELEFTNYTVERTYKNCLPEQGNCTFINLTYPVIVTDNTAAENINLEVNDHVIKIVNYQDDLEIESSEDLADKFIKNYEESAADFQDYETPWEASVFGEILLQNEDIISIKINSDLFTGGAHGYSSVSFLNFNPETGERYSHDQLFSSDFKAFAEDEFRKEKDISSGEPINNTGLFFEDDEFELPENIGFTSSKVIVHYNTYEIASYAEGTFTLEFPVEEVQQYLNISLKENSPESI